MKRRMSALGEKRPATCQKSIPIGHLWADGIMESGGEYSVCYELGDTNYAGTSDENQAEILLRYEELIKSVATDAYMKVVLMNTVQDEEEMSRLVRVEPRGDGLDSLRRELNEINGRRALEGENRIGRQRFLTVTRPFSSRREAAAWFRRAGEDVEKSVRAMGADARRLSGEERVAQLRAWHRPDARKAPPAARPRGQDALLDHVADRICPERMAFPAEGTWFEMDGTYGRVLRLAEYPSRLDDTLLTDLLDMPRRMILAADYEALGKEEALRLVNRQKDRVEMDIRKRTVNSGREGNWNASIPRHLEEEREACNRLYDCVSREDQRIVMGQVLVCHLADSLEQLSMDTAAIRAAAAGKGAEVSVLRHRQERGLLTVLPYGWQHVGQPRVLSSENASFFMPFRTKEIFDPGGIVYGVNEISKNLVVASRPMYKNGNGFIVGDAGGGKSVLSKYEILSVMLGTEDDLVILDPDGEYGRMTRWLGGQVVRIAPDSPDAINMLDISEDFDTSDNPVTLKCGLVSGAVDLMMRGSMSGAERSVTDRCVHAVLSRPRGGSPTLRDVYEELRRQDEPAAAEVALAMEIYTVGSLSIFSRPTSVDVRSRLLCFDIKDLGPQMRDLGMMVVLDEIDRRVAANRARGRHTWVWADEIWTLLSFPQTSEYLWGFWKRCRKYGGLPTGITQSLSALNASERGREMLANSEFVLMMGMSQEDRSQAQELFSLSPDQLDRLSRARPGHGLMRVGKVVIPLDATVPTDTEFYKAATTRLGEVADAGMGARFGRRR